MSDEPLYCTRCGAEDWDCQHGSSQPDGSDNPNADDGKGPFCEVSFAHEWPNPEGPCLDCGCRFGDWITEEERSHER